MRTHILISGLFAVTSIAFANEPALESIVSKVAGKDVKVTKTFDTDVGLNGHVVQAEGKPPIIVFTDKKNQFLFSGIVMDATGRNLTREAAMKYLPKKMETVGEGTSTTKPVTEMIKTANASGSLIEMGKGTAKREMYILGEPNCGYCKQIFRDLQPALQSGRVKVKWLMVGFNPDGVNKSAWALDQREQGKALSAVFSGQASGLGSKASQDKIAANVDFMSKFGVRGTPYVFSKSKDGAGQTAPGAIPAKEIASFIENIPE